MYDSLQPHGLQHIRLPCPSLCPRVCSNSRPLSQWCHPTISFSAILFSCPQSFPASGSSPKSRLFISSGQFWNFSFSTSPSNEYSGLISFRIELVWSSCYQRESQESFFSTTVWKHQLFGAQPSSWSNSDICTVKTLALTICTFISKVVSLLYSFFIFIYLAAFYLLNGLSLQHVGSSSLTRDQTQVPFLGVWHLTHWTTREVPVSLLFNTLSRFIILSF